MGTDVSSGSIPQQKEEDWWQMLAQGYNLPPSPPQKNKQWAQIPTVLIRMSHLHYLNFIILGTILTTWISKSIF